MLEVIYVIEKEENAKESNGNQAWDRHSNNYSAFISTLLWESNQTM